MIKGLGIDLVSVKRIEGLLEEYGDRFRQRCFTKEEILYCQDKMYEAEHLAARFAAKEALVKALPLKCKLSWHEAVVSVGKVGPELKLYGRAAQIAKKYGIKSVMVSLSHEREFAVALVIIS